jgi:hypothetical protein
MINEIKKDTYKCLNGFKENINKQLNETRKRKQIIKEGFNKYMDILKKSIVCIETMKYYLTIKNKII